MKATQTCENCRVSIISTDQREHAMNRRLAQILIWISLSTSPILAQSAPEGIWQGYDGEWKHVSQQLIALAEATPAEKFTWRPSPGVRSTSEVYMHVALANFYLLSVTGPKMPADITGAIDCVCANERCCAAVVEGFRGVITGFTR